MNGWLGAEALAVHRARDDFTDAALAADQHRGVGARDASDEVEQEPITSVAGPDHAVRRQRSFVAALELLAFRLLRTEHRFEFGELAAASWKSYARRASSRGCLLLDVLPNAVNASRPRSFGPAP